MKRMIGPATVRDAPGEPMADNPSSPEHTVDGGRCDVADGGEDPPQRLLVTCVVAAGAWPDELQGAVDRLVDVVCRHVAAAREPASATVQFDDDAAVADLNRRYRGKSGPTNVLSFPSDEIDFDTGVPYRGDVTLACETVVREAGALEIALGDHVIHLVCHGLLHLFGHDHDTDSDAEEMEQLEIAILGELGIANPYMEERSAQTIDA